MAPEVPKEVELCLRNARFLHLATCTNLTPHVSLMNYTYLAPDQEAHSIYAPATPTIVMTVSPHSKKTLNLLSNPKVSLLVHDWVSPRPPTVEPPLSRSPPSPPLSRNGPRTTAANAGQGSLATLLFNLNSSSLSNISVTINGTARMVEKGTEEEKFLREVHLDNNTFDEAGELRRVESRGIEQSDGGRGRWIDDDDVRVVLVQIKDGRISDWRGEVKDWAVEVPIENPNGSPSRLQPLTNGIQ